MVQRKIQPKETKANILNVAEKLFVKQGYEKTTMQEIVDITGLAKGTIFHHFKSKEEILISVLEAHCDRDIQVLDKWLVEVENLNAREILTKFFDEPTPEESSLLVKMAVSTSSPHIIVTSIKKCIEKISPIVVELIRKGIEDGSITTDFPDECAQLFLILYTIWLDPITIECDSEALYKRLQFIQYTMKVLGVDIVSDDFIEHSMKFAENLYKNKE